MWTAVDVEGCGVVLSNVERCGVCGAVWIIVEGCGAVWTSVENVAYVEDFVMVRSDVKGFGAVMRNVE